MQLIIKTKVKGYYLDVYKRFDLKLFQFLLPKFGKVEVAKFTGSQKGDIVHIKFIKPLKTDWISEIIEDNITEESAYFVDSGTHLPWPLKTWRHDHIVKKESESHSEIIDDMNFSTGYFLFDLLIWPFLFLSFYPRKRLYKKYFNTKDGS
jgi:ligand-binding SRPBCC domain-containing protein